MRRRLVLGFFGLAILVVSLYGVPRAYILANLVRHQEQHRVDDTATVLSRVINLENTPITTATLDSLNNDYEWIVVHRGGTTIGTTGSQSGPPSGDLTATRALAHGGSITVGLSEPVVSSAVADALVPLILLGLGVILLAGTTIYLLAPRLARPYQKLAEAARGLGLGQLHPDLPNFRTPELREVAQALTASGHQIEAMLAHERKLAVHASHELRTPIAAMRLELEDLALWKETHPLVAAELRQATGELDRLTAAVDDLLMLSRERRERDQQDVDLELLVADAVRLLDDPEGRVVHQRDGALPTRVHPLPVVRIVRDLLEAMLASGAHGVAVTTVEQETHLEVVVQTVGHADSTPEVRTATLELAAALGGHITRDGTTVTLRLPAHSPA